MLTLLNGRLRLSAAFTSYLKSAPLATEHLRRCHRASFDSAHSHGSQRLQPEKEQLLCPVRYMELILTSS